MRKHIISTNILSNFKQFLKNAYECVWGGGELILRRMGQTFELHIHQLAQERGGYQDPSPPATAVSRGLRVPRSLRPQSHCPTSQRGRCGRWFLISPRPPFVTPRIPRPSGFEHLATLQYKSPQSYKYWNVKNVSFKIL